MKIPFLFLLAVSFGMALTAEQTTLVRVLDLAGMPPETLPSAGTLLTIKPEANGAGPDHLGVFHGEERIGYLPARMRESIHLALQAGAQVRARVYAPHPHPAPGRFLQVEIELVPRHPGDESVSLVESSVLLSMRSHPPYVPCENSWD